MRRTRTSAYKVCLACRHCSRSPAAISWRATGKIAGPHGPSHNNGFMCCPSGNYAAIIVTAQPGPTSNDSPRRRAGHLACRDTAGRRGSDGGGRADRVEDLSPGGSPPREVPTKNHNSESPTQALTFGLAIGQPLAYLMLRCSIAARRSTPSHTGFARGRPLVSGEDGASPARKGLR